MAKYCNKRGFTLVELVVVIAIIGILSAILIPAIIEYIKKAQKKVDIANAKKSMKTLRQHCC